MTEDRAPAGWYKTQAGRLRWWDGTTWTDRFQDEDVDGQQIDLGIAPAPGGQDPMDQALPLSNASAAPEVWQQAEQTARTPANRQSGFHFDGGAATYWGTTLLAILITVLTLFICYPFALVLRERWRAKHTYIDGHRLRFTGTGLGLFGLWIKWLLLIVITLTIYSFWVAPRVQKWKVEHTDFDPTWQGAQFDRSAA